MATALWQRSAPKCFAASVLMLLAGCAKAPMTFSLQRWGKTTVIVPPNQKSANENSGLLVANVKNIRRQTTTTNCNVDGLVALQWHGKAVEIKIRSESYVADRTEGIQSGGAVSGIYLDPLQDIARFHSQLSVLETIGCLSSAEATRIRR